jgi:hypothetical protein
MKTVIGNTSLCVTVIWQVKSRFVQGPNKSDYQSKPRLQSLNDLKILDNETEEIHIQQRPLSCKFNSAERNVQINKLKTKFIKCLKIMQIPKGFQNFVFFCVFQIRDEGQSPKAQ